MALQASPIRPSYKTGFARNAAESAHPELWDGLIGMWCPGLGAVGRGIRDNSGRGAHATIGFNLDSDTWLSTTRGYAFRIKSGQVVSTPDPAITVQSATFLSVVYPTSLDAYGGVMFSRGASGTSQHGMLQGGSSGNLTYGWNNNGWQFSGGPAITLNKWNVLASVNVYLSHHDLYAMTDGSFAHVQDSTYASDAATFDAPLDIGRDSFGTRYFKGDYRFAGFWDRALSEEEIRLFAADDLAPLLIRRRPAVFVPPLSATATLSGTAVTAPPDESDIVTGGKTIICTLDGDTFKPAGTGVIGSTADTEQLIFFLQAATTPTNGWNNEVRSAILLDLQLVRDSDTQCTLTLPAVVNYAIDTDETVTWTIPNDVLVGGLGPIVAAPTFDVTAVAAPVSATFTVAGQAATDFQSAQSTSATFTISGTAATNLLGEGVAEATCTITGTASADFVSDVTGSGAFDIAGQATTNFASAAIQARQFTISGVAATNFVGSGGIGAVFTITGQATTNLLGEGIAAAACTITGVAATNFASAAIQPATFTINGLATTNFKPEITVAGWIVVDSVTIAIGTAEATIL